MTASRGGEVAVPRSRGESDRPAGANPTLTQILRTVGRLLRGEKRSHWLLLLFMGLLSSLMEALSAGMIYVLLSMVTGRDDMSLPVVGDIRGLFAGADSDRRFVVVSTVIGAFFVVRGVLLVVQSYVQHRLTLHAGVRLSRRLFSGYMAMPYEFHLHRNSSELIRNCHDSISILTRDVLHPATRIVSEGLIMLGLVAVLLWTAPVATLVAVALLGLTAAVLLRVVHPRIDDLSAVNQAMAARTFKVLQHSFGGIREIAVLGCQGVFVRSYVQTRGELARANYWWSTLSEIPRAALEAVLVLFIIGLFLLGTAVEGAALGVIPVLGVFGYAGLRLKPSMTVIIRGVTSIRFAGAAVGQLDAELRLFPQAGGTPVTGDSAPLPFRRCLLLEDVSFTYAGAASPALRGATLQVARGEAIGVVGPTGAGKSTLLDLVLGLLMPNEGRITVDGVDIHEDLPGWRRNLGVVPQSVFLIDDTLRRNIAFGVPDDEIDEGAVGRAVRLAQLDVFVERLPKGLDTEIGERGVRVSGGQRQRVAIARALYRDPTVLVFDEGTSALDNRTEAEFIEALRRLRGSLTMIMVAHRLSTVRDCDRIVVIEDGRLVDVGTYEELLVGSRAFRELAQQAG